MSNEENSALAALAEERLALEREALEIERGRLAAAKTALHAEAKLARGGRPVALAAGAALVALAAFAAGMLFGVRLGESHAEARRSERLAQTLSRIDALTGGTVTNGVSDADGRRNLSVLVIQ